MGITLAPPVICLANQAGVKITEFSEKKNSKALWLAHGLDTLNIDKPVCFHQN
jgi:hypothetical protein